MKKQKGFTLIELLIVIAIILIAGSALYKYTH
jgi:prepilin-type N-terminal cleavage/methylation domain-containing protein